MASRGLRERSRNQNVTASVELPPAIEGAAANVNETAGEQRHVRDRVYEIHQSEGPLAHEPVIVGGKIDIADARSLGRTALAEPVDCSEQGKGRRHAVASEPDRFARHRRRSQQVRKSGQVPNGDKCIKKSGVEAIDADAARLIGTLIVTRF
jgi:hypothetical protein